MEQSVERRRLLPVLGGNRQKKAAEFDSERKFRPQVYWYLSFRCNLACAHCSVHSSPTVDTSDDIDTLGAMRVVEQLVELNAGSVVLTGGEALIRPDALEILGALADNRISTALETNGIKIPRGFTELALRMQAERLLGITVSLDGGTAEAHDRLRGPNAFRRTVRNLHKLAEAGVRFNVQCVVNRSSVETIPDLYDLGAELWPHLRTLVFTLLNPVGRGEGLIAELGIGLRELSRILDLVAENKPRFPGGSILKTPPAAVPPAYLKLVFADPKVRSTSTCQFPLLGVLPNGDVTICALSRDNDDLYFGNTRELTLKEIWQRTRMDMLRSSYLAAELTGICADCVWKHTCKGACRAWAYEEGGSFSDPFPLCAALDEAGDFPQAYRISAQQAALDRSELPLAGAGCGCASPEALA
jgi:radical SAM protein with 4Fe4S-binding SPASM domain